VRHIQQMLDDVKSKNMPMKQFENVSDRCGLVL
jgi:hypothetical protein